MLNLQHLEETERIKKTLKLIDCKIFDCLTERLRLMDGAFDFKIPYGESIFSDGFEKELKDVCPQELKEIYTLMLHAFNLVVSNKKVVEERRQMEAEALANFKRDDLLD